MQKALLLDNIVYAFTCTTMTPVERQENYVALLGLLGDKIDFEECRYCFIMDNAFVEATLAVHPEWAALVV